MPDRVLKGLLSPPFFVSFSVTLHQIFLERYGGEPVEPIRLFAKLPYLYTTTRSYPVWCGTVFSLATETNPLQHQDEFERFVETNAPVRVTPDQISHALSLYSPLLGLPEHALDELFDGPPITLDDARDFYMCRPCCYDNRPRGCRVRFDPDKHRCFDKCIRPKVIE